jgi:hypothetical protein
MANIDAKFGLRPYRQVGGNYNNQGVGSYSIQTASITGVANAIYYGQPVIPLATGMISYAGSAAGGTVANLGVFVGCEYTDLTGKPVWSNYYPGTASLKSSTACKASIVDDPYALYLINCDAAAADGLVFSNADFVTSTTGSTTTGVSYGELDVSSSNTTATLNLRILGFEDSPGNSDKTAAGRLAIVRLNVQAIPTVLSVG